MYRIKRTHTVCLTWVDSPSLSLSLSLTHTSSLCPLPLKNKQAFVDLRRASHISHSLASNRTHYTRCKHREFCPRGIKCRYNHTTDELALFKSSGSGASPYKRLKYTPCNRALVDGCSTAPSKCEYLHTRSEKFLCVRCLRFTKYGVDCRCESERSFRPVLLKDSDLCKQLKRDGYLHYSSGSIRKSEC